MGEPLTKRRDLLEIRIRQCRGIRADFWMEGVLSTRIGYRLARQSALPDNFNPFQECEGFGGKKVSKYGARSGALRSLNSRRRQEHVAIMTMW